MAYFANGTEGSIYEENYCDKCKNWRKGGCPIMDLHLIYSYELCNSKSVGKKMLDFLIPEDEKNCCADKCSMFLKKENK